MQLKIIFIQLSKQTNRETYSKRTQQACSRNAKKFFRAEAILPFVFASTQSISSIRLISLANLLRQESAFYKSERNC